MDLGRFSYEVVSSALQDDAERAAILGPLARLLEAAGGTCGEPGGDRPGLFLVLTGGTERLVLDRVETRRARAVDEPVLLIAHRSHNSLPACLEILARVRRDGGCGEIVLLDDSVAATDRLARTVRLASVRQRLHASRIGVIGSPSEWLVASEHDAAAVRRAWGPELVEVPVSELRATISGASAGHAEAGPVLAAARRCVEPDRDDVARAGAVTMGLRKLAHERRLDALTIRCFDLVTEDRLTACLALSTLADEGLPAGCEGDIPSVLALLWSRLLLDRAGWMANPAWIDPDRGQVLLAHCTAPRSLGSAFSLRTHFESGLGVAVEAELRCGRVTLMRIGGSALDQLWSAEGELVDCPREAGLCRTQALVRVEPARVEELLAHPLGNHLVLVHGHHEAALKGYLAQAR